MVSEAQRAAPRHRPPLDPELAAVLAAMPEVSRSILPEHVPMLRSRDALGGLRASDDGLRRGGRVCFTEHRVPVGADGTAVGLLVLRPAAGAGPWPGIYYLHGGGMMFGDNRTGVELLLDWVAEHDVVVASLDYRLAPEHPHPTPAEDCYAGLVWIAEHAAQLGIDDRGLLVVGSSAGGGLAAAVSLMSRDRDGPTISDQLLFSPMLDDRNVTPSSHELEGDVPWDRRSNITAWDALLGRSRGRDGVSEYAAPARARDLGRLPPTYLDVGAVETFRDEIVDFGARLARAGVSVELHVWAGAFHGFDLLAPTSAVATAARAARTAYLVRRLRQRSS